MNRHMFDRLAPEIASRGYRVITIDTLGHGASDRPDDMRLYNMPAFGEQIAALIDHLELDRPVVGGTSLGANAALEFGAALPGQVARPLRRDARPRQRAPRRGAGLHAGPPWASLRAARSCSRSPQLLRRVPRTSLLVDVALDWLRQDPGPSRAVLEGILFHRTAPPHSTSACGIAEPALVIGHPSDPLHPFSDAGMLVEEMENARLVDANSILEWRLTPGRLDDILEEFLARVVRSRKRHLQPKNRSLA